MQDGSMPKGVAGPWGAAPQAGDAGLVPVMVLMSEAQRAAMLGAGGFVVPELPLLRQPSRLDALYDEAMARFDAFCFWYARPPRTRQGLAVVAERLEAYGSAEALRIAEEVRTALAAAT